jgi:predicted phosphodiesterase
VNNLIAYVIDNFRVVGGKLERLVDETWVDTTTYADQKRIKVNGVMIKREEVTRILECNAQPLEEETAAWSAKAQVRLQRQMDSNRIERALFRKEARELNSRNELFEEMIKLLESSKIGTPAPPIKWDKDGPVLCLALNDIHYGEKVALANNSVDTTVISKRLYKYVREAIAVAGAFGCKRAMVFMLGDMTNSSRRPSEYLSNEFTTSHAAVNAIEITSQIISLLSHHFSVTDVVSVCGNESSIRLSDNQFGFEPKMLMSNFDYIIHEALRAIFPSVRFSDWGNPLERIVSLHGRNILLTHGITLARKSPEHQMLHYKTKYGSDVHYIISGHVHEACNTPFFSRAGSPIGSNAFSELSLGIPVSVPSQTFHIVRSSGIVSIPVDLSFGCDEFFKFTAPPTDEAVISTKLDLG